MFIFTLLIVFEDQYTFNRFSFTSSSRQIYFGNGNGNLVYPNIETYWLLPRNSDFYPDHIPHFIIQLRTAPGIKINSPSPNTHVLSDQQSLHVRSSPSAANHSGWRGPDSDSWARNKLPETLGWIGEEEFVWRSGVVSACRRTRWIILYCAIQAVDRYYCVDELRRVGVWVGYLICWGVIMTWVVRNEGELMKEY